MLDYVENQINIPLKDDSKQRINSTNKIKKKVIKGIRKLIKEKLNLHIRFYFIKLLIYFF